jgi:hypothetical protein
MELPLAPEGSSILLSDHIDACIDDFHVPLLFRGRGAMYINAEGGEKATQKRGGDQTENFLTLLCPLLHV